MVSPIRSEEDKRIVRSLAKKSGKKKINVYFNKKSSSGATKYITGKYFSAKNDEHFEYKSSYELAFYMQLEKSEKVLKYMYEPFEVPYVDFYQKERNYRPDLLILNADGSVVIAEVKPTLMLKDYDVQAKAKAARLYIKENYKDLNIKFMFITEKDIFKSNADYINFIKLIKLSENEQS